MNTFNKDLLGFAGPFAGGKDTLANFLVKDHGYTHVSTGDMVREVAMRERGSIERPVLREVADEYRHKLGAGAFVVIALEKPRPLAVSGLRSLGEAKAIKEADGTLVYVDAPLAIRYERMIARHRDAETQITMEEFAERERQEWHVGDDDADFNLEGIKAMSDVFIDSDQSLELFIGSAYQDLGLK